MTHTTHTQSSIRILLACPDAKGVIAAVTQFIAERQGNIIDLDQHADQSARLFVMRIEIEPNTLATTPADFERDFQSLEQRFALTTTYDWGRSQKSLVIFASKEDHCLSDLLWRANNNELPAKILAVIANHQTFAPLAASANVPFHHIPISPDTKHQAESQAQSLLNQLNPDLIVLARYMQILSPDFIAQCPQQIINIHHSFLPAFPGARPYHRAHERGVKLIGATAHYVTNELDEGPIIAQNTAPVTHRDNIDALKRIGRDLERITLAQAVRLHLGDRVLTVANRTVVFH